MKATQDGYVCKMCNGGNMLINENDEKRLSFNSGDCIESVKRFFLSW